jgi:hypothetical protein
MGGIVSTSLSILRECNNSEIIEDILVDGAKKITTKKIPISLGYWS